MDGDVGLVTIHDGLDLELNNEYTINDELPKTEESSFSIEQPLER